MFYLLISAQSKESSRNWKLAVPKHRLRLPEGIRRPYYVGGGLYRVREKETTCEINEKGHEQHTG